jgi:beta-lactamase class D
MVLIIFLTEINIRKILKTIYFISCLIVILSCTSANNNNKNTEKDIDRSEYLRQDFQQILDSANVIGSVLVFDPQSKIAYSNDFKRCDKGYLPASTFKIPNSIIALETGVVENDSTLFKWNGEKRRLPVWEQDLIFRDAFQFSCVPCYQEIARKIGVKRMNEYLLKLNYGNMVVDSGNLDRFWLEGESSISMNQQLNFLNRFYETKLPISKRTYEIMKRLLLIESNDSWKFSGKTGWAIRKGNNVGWFTGYLETRGKVYFVVTNIEPKEAFDLDLFPVIRTQISLGALRKLKLIE